MKLYIMLTALGLTASTALGYWNGRESAHAGFVNACLDSRFAVVYDQGSDAHRHFHCFELADPGLVEPETDIIQEGHLVL